MAGIYLHIPFCKQACHYCDFHFSTNMKVRHDLILAMADEISLQKDYLDGEELQTVYFGGGTPSILEVAELSLLLNQIFRTHCISATPEITLEANPDDLTPSKLRDLKSAGINRLSIGIQSFDNRILSWLNRTHSAETAVHCVSEAQDAGFQNLSIDLIYAIPDLSDEGWRKTIELAIGLQTPHISAYTLTIEEKTVFGNWLKKGKLNPVDESGAARQMEMLVSILNENGFRQYEISNFARPGFESVHNSNYWNGAKYLGIGPSAHSFNKTSRQQNISNNHLYVRAILDKKIPAEKETLGRDERINEYILTTLRTETGCDLDFLKRNFGYDVLTTHAGYLSRLQDEKLIRLDYNHLKLTDAGKLLADRISSDLFLVKH